MPHTTVIGDLSIPVGTYTVRENNQEKTRKRHRQIGVVMETIFDDGGRSMSVRLNAEILCLPLASLMRANGMLPKGDDSVMCPIYRREAKDKAGPAAAEPSSTGEPGEDVVPF